MELNYATVVEAMADSLPDSTCLVCGTQKLSYAQFEQRAARLAQCLADHGLGRESKVGLFLYNCSEYMESTLAAHKLRAISVNVNYRYTGNELVYLLQDCDAEALVFHSSLADRISEIRDQLPGLKLIIRVDDGGGTVDGALEYAQILQSVSPAPRIERSPKDTLMLYTGGTTGMPKGVEYNIGDMLTTFTQMMPAILGIQTPTSLEELVSQALERAESSDSLVSLPASPLMHTAAIVNSGIQAQVFGGAMVILQSRSFDPRELWQAVQAHRVNHMVVVGDTFIKPMLQVIEEDSARGIEYDLTSLKLIVSSGVMFSRESKEKLLELGDMIIMDGAGASEGGMALQLSSRQNPPTDTGQVIALPTTEIFNERYEKLPRGCGEVGLIGMGGNLPRGYYKDPEKTAKTFKTIDGARWGFTGDMGSIDENGLLTFMGRGSNCINTGGEKVFPEEVEEIIKLHPQVIDCLVVGLPDDRFGQSVAAVVSLRSGIESPKDALLEFASAHLARYKLPRTVNVVNEVKRAPNGKADYKWARKCFDHE